MRSSRSFSSCLAFAVLAAAISPAPAHGQAAEQKLIRVWGYKGMSAQLERWEAGYSGLHPGVRFRNELHAPAAVMAGLYNGVADVALMGREIWPVETMAYHWVFQQQPFGVAVATAGLNGPGQSFTPVVMVHADNPLTEITTGQLDAIYGSEHRAAPANIRTWGELGLSGAWSSRKVEPYGFGPEDALGVYFRHDILRSDFKPNPDAHLFSDHDRTSRPAAVRIAAAVEGAPGAIGYGAHPAASAAKVLAVNGVRPTDETVADHTYPLARTLSIYVHRVPDQPLDGTVNDFPHYILSPDAQKLVSPGEGFLPLTPALAAAEVTKLDRPMPKDTAAASEDAQ